ncbi:Mfa1 family fimbria major subunit [Bacteroides gallinaceum]|uniref:Mfa1 family fimbria major subunit n=1 Tax=Bacteroides gallinaceum TaxID=1462571 RepID=UPI001956292A|nr:Mfa1 family fimbria major subunit [Bacteroides gallinaceum]MBM6659387.1 Mfa1 family fimbria major subunit [Bacteroides gallinaceum]
MKRSGLYIIMCIFGLLGWAGCSEDAMLPDEQTNVPSKTLLTLNFAIEGENAASRAEGDDSPEHPAVDWEDDIVTLQVFIKHADDTWEEPIYLWDITGSPYTIKLNDLDLTETTVYVGANLTMEQTQAFIQQETDDAAYTFTNNAFDLVTDLSPYSTENSDLTGRRHIAMFCTEGIVPQVIEKDEDGKPTKYTTSGFSLKRMVAKILVTCKADETITDGETNVDYVPVSESFEGWIRQSDVKYLVNGLNRKTYIMQQIDPKATEPYANVVDPNNRLSESVSNNGDFYFQPIEGAYDSPYLRSALPFVKTSLSSYTEGIYCPENTFALDETIQLEGQQPQITHVCVAAKFTPQNLWVEYDLFDYVANQQNIEPEVKEAIKQLRPSDGKPGDVVEIECTSEAVASQLLLSSLQRANNRNGFPEGTYFYHNKKKAFYTYGAMGRDGVSMDDIDTNPGVFGDFVPYIGGWGYYYTYVDNREDYELTPNDWNEFYRHGQVERNRYYILNITGFSRPGSSVTNPNYIMVHTYSLPWEKGGSGEITLNPEDEIK